MALRCYQTDQRRFGLLNTAIVGGAVTPLVQGFIADRIGIHHAFVLAVICYLYILLFAAKGQAKQRVASPAPVD